MSEGKMPVINFSYADLCDLVGRDLPKQALRERLPMLGADLKSADDSSDEMSFEFFPNRADLYSVEGIARALRSFLGIEPGLRTYAVGESTAELNVSPSVMDVRPFIWSALVEDNEINDALIRSMMDLQEKLHLTVGRNRKKVAIGIHDYAKVKGPFTYKAVLPDEVSFIPLQGSVAMTPSEILKEHDKGKAYAFVLEGKKRYPLIVDRKGEVLSFPPIINGIATAVTEETKDILVDCTGTDLNAVKQAVNILTTALAERGGKIKTIKVKQDGKTMLAPDLQPHRAKTTVDAINGWIGTSLSAEQVTESLMKMGHGVKVLGGNIEVLTGAFRADILHSVDLAEDVAIGYGFERFGNTLPKQATFGREDGLIAFSNSLKEILIGLGYFEVVTLSLSNPREQYFSMNLEDSRTAIRVRNPVSEQHVLLRTSLLPSLMTILRKNKHRDLPQRVFEIGDVVLGTSNKKLLAGASIHGKASFTEAKSVVQSVVHGIGLSCDVETLENPTYLKGRCAGIMVGGEIVGMFGEVSPSTITAFELKYPVVAFEMDAEKLLSLGGKRSSD
jgi:phenylalanyl-tRNA synthetase beta chain